MLSDQAIVELADIISRNFPQVAFWVPLIKKRILKDGKFLSELSGWVIKNAGNQ